MFQPAYLSATDHVFGSTNLNVVDTLAFTTAARVQAGKFDDTRNIEVIRLDVAGIDLTVSQQLAGSSQRGFLTISGSEGADIVSGQPTDPSRGPVTTPLVFNSGGGADRFTGGEGNDTVRVDENSTGSVLDGRGGNDTLYYWGTGTRFVRPNFDSAILGSVTGFETVEIADRGPLTAEAILRDNLFGPGQTTLNVILNNESIVDASNIGADKTLTVTLTPGGHRYTGGAGVDIVRSENVSPYAPDNDVIRGGAGNDDIVGQGALYGDAGDDRLVGTGARGDTLYGGDGNDIISDSNAHARSGSSADGGAGNDQINLARGGRGHGGSGDDLLTSIWGGASLYGDDGNDTLIGGSGNDSLYGGTGINIIDGGAGQSDVGGFDFSDRTGIVRFDGGGVRGVTYAATVGGVFAGSMTNIERYFIIGGSGNDFLTTLTSANFSGGAGNDTLNGGASDDTLRGDDGNDILNGGTGFDTAVYAGDRANFTITQVGSTTVITDATGAEGIDTVSSVERFAFADEIITLAGLLGPQNGGQTTAFLAVDSDVTVLTPAFALADAPLGAEAFEAAGAGLGGGFDRLEGIPHLA